MRSFELHNVFWCVLLTPMGPSISSFPRLATYEAGAACRVPRQTGGPLRLITAEEVGYGLGCQWARAKRQVLAHVSYKRSWHGYSLQMWEGADIATCSPCYSVLRKISLVIAATFCVMAPTLLTSRMISRLSRQICTSA